MNEPFQITPPRSGHAPLVLDSPHSGSNYPDDFRPAVSIEVLRQAEDSYVDELYGSGPDVGARPLMTPGANS